MIKIAICDDNRYERKNLISILKKIALSNNIEIDIEEFEKGHSLIDAYIKDLPKYNIIFLDILLGDINGLKVAKVIREKDILAKVILLSSSKEYILDGYDVAAMSYLIKPATEEKIEKNLLRAIKESNINSIDSYEANKSGKTIIFDLKDIFYFEARLGKVILHKKDSTFEFYEKINSIDKKLNKKGFERCHRSYIINISKIKEFKNTEVILANEESIPIGRKYKGNIKEAFMQYLTLR